MAQDQRKTELTAELAQARHRIARNIGALRNDLDLPARAKKAVLQNPVAWVGGGALFGLLLAKLPARKKKVLVNVDGSRAKMSAGKAGLIVSSLKIAFDLLRPAIAKWASQRIAETMERPRNDRGFS